MRCFLFKRWSNWKNPLSKKVLSNTCWHKCCFRLNPLFFVHVKFVCVFVCVCQVSDSFRLQFVVVRFLCKHEFLRFVVVVARVFVLRNVKYTLAVSGTIESNHTNCSIMCEREDG